MKYNPLCNVEEKQKGRIAQAVGRFENIGDTPFFPLEKANLSRLFGVNIWECFSCFI